jgi:hypothetical protein
MHVYVYICGCILLIFKRFHCLQALRSYDNRCRQSDRTSKVYLESEVAEDTTKLLVLGDADHLELQHKEDRKKWRLQDWLWNQGGLTIISTPFHKGRHWAKSPAEFVPIVQHLEKLHADGFVHADIRAFNIVFNGDEGRLIDFEATTSSLKF